MTCSIVTYNSPVYQAIVDLRNEVLRKPFGRILLDEELKNESNDTFLACLDDHSMVIGCCILTCIDPKTVKLRQMAIKQSEQGKRFGFGLLQFAEQTAIQRGFETVQLNARTTAVGFYQKSGYTICSEEFLQVGIPHFTMFKKINQSFSI